MAAGTPLSGKSTIRRHLEILDGVAFGDDDRLRARESIVIELMSSFVTAWQDMMFAHPHFSALENNEEVCL